MIPIERGDGRFGWGGSWNMDPTAYSTKVEKHQSKMKYQTIYRRGDAKKLYAHTVVPQLRGMKWKPGPRKGRKDGTC